jgi:hypothetical protein
MNAPTKRRLLPVLVLLLIFFLPLGFAFLMYYGSSWRPAGHTNHGTLIQPPRSLPREALQRADGGAAADLLTGKWTLIYIGDGTCDEACHQALYFMRQTQLSLGNLIPRTQRIWLATDHCCDLSADPQGSAADRVECTQRCGFQTAGAVSGRAARNHALHR